MPTVTCSSSSRWSGGSSPCTSVRESRVRRELRRVREATHVADDVALVDAIADEQREADDRVARSRRRCSTGCSPRSTSRPTRSWSSTASGARSCATRPPAASPARAHGEVLAEDAIDELAAGTRSTASRSERELQLYGPPRQVLQLRAFPLRRDGEIVGAVAFTRATSRNRGASRACAATSSPT